MEEIKKLNDEEMEQAAGGFYPDDEELEELALSNYVRNAEWGWHNYYYDTKRGDDEWKHVAYNHMEEYVKNTLGENDWRYQALVRFHETGKLYDDEKNIHCGR